METMKKTALLPLISLALLAFMTACSGSPGRDSALYGNANPPVSPQGSPGPVPPGTQNTTTGETTDAAAHFFYFSYDDSASTAAVELVKYQLNNNIVPSSQLARPWEFLNFESFSTLDSQPIGTFSASMGIMSRPSATPDTTEYHLGVNVCSPKITTAERQNVVLTLVVDVSGSMDELTSRVNEISSTKLDVVRYGLQQMAASLKEGDVVNLVTFSSDAQIVLQNVPFSQIASDYIPAVDALSIRDSTNLDAGIRKGYEVALGTLDQAKLNRVVIITDAYANVGEVDSTVIATNTRINELEGIYFSGIGVGGDFNEAFLNDLTEAGKGAYFSLITKNDARKALQDRFIALVSVAAKQVRFRLDYPVALTHTTTASEESSTVAQDVKPTNFSYNTCQYFYEVFIGAPDIDLTQTFTLSVAYTDPLSSQLKTETLSRPMGELIGLQENNIRDAEIIFLFTQLLDGRVTGDTIDNILNTSYAGYSSAHFAEYTGLMNKYRGLAPVPAP